MKPYSNLKLAAGGSTVPTSEAKPAATPAAKPEDSYSYGQRFGNFARNPTENNTVNYGILGGVGALGAGGLAYLLSSPENRKRNALIFALLGGGAGLAGKYYADKGFATPADKPVATPAAATPGATPGAKPAAFSSESGVLDDVNSAVEGIGNYFKSLNPF